MFCRGNEIKTFQMRDGSLSKCLFSEQRHPLFAVGLPLPSSLCLGPGVYVQPGAIMGWIRLGVKCIGAQSNPCVLIKIDEDENTVTALA